MSSPSERFAKLLFPLLGLCIVSQAILISFTVVGGTTVSGPGPAHNYYVQLDRQEKDLQKKLDEPPGANAQKLKELALVYWQNNKLELALPYLDEVWHEHNSSNTTTYDSLFVEDGLNLAGLYLDRGSNEMAIVIYERLLAYDKAHVDPVSDGRVGRDYNNLGLCCLQTGEALPELKLRREWFLRAIEKFATAEKIFSSSPKYEQQQVCSLQNLVVAYSELGEDDKAMHLSELVNKRLDAWHDQLSNSPSEKPKTISPKSMSLPLKFSISSGSAQTTPLAHLSTLEIRI